MHSCLLWATLNSLCKLKTPKLYFRSAFLPLLQCKFDMHRSPELDLSSTTLNMNTSFTSSKVWLNYLLIYIMKPQCCWYIVSKLVALIKQIWQVLEGNWCKTSWNELNFMLSRARTPTSTIQREEFHKIYWCLSVVKSHTPCRSAGVFKIRTQLIKPRGFNRNYHEKKRMEWLERDECVSGKVCTYC